jgi:hypothetical protein
MMDRLEELVEELVTISGPAVVPGEPAEDWEVSRRAWERRVKSLCGQIFNQGRSAGWDKYHDVMAEYVSERRP